MGSFSTDIRNKKLLLFRKKDTVVFSESFFARLYAFFISGLIIGVIRRNKEQPLTGSSRDIITKIHTIRYHPDNPYVTSGGHFYQLYIRNLGIFYNALVDPRIDSGEKDWINRQEIALKTVVLILEILSKSEKIYTTIAPLKDNLYTAMNIYTYPSDSLFGILYTLLALTDKDFISHIYPSGDKQTNQLMTQKTVKDLIETHKKSLTFHIQAYKARVFDKNTGLIRKRIRLSGARDGIKRQSSFYDNVILWSTYAYAKKLSLVSISKRELNSWKRHIITTFWDENTGIFRDDLSGKTEFSADCFIMIQSGFLTCDNRQDREKIHKIISYVRKHGLDKPFPLHYAQRNTGKKLYWPVRFFARSYMGKSIWSHWGMEYIKTLLLLAKDDPTYRAEAKKHLLVYERNIKHFGGYPELYDASGNIFKTPFYKSVLHTGWVINYEQAHMLFNAA